MGGRALRRLDAPPGKQEARCRNQGFVVVGAGHGPALFLPGPGKGGALWAQASKGDHKGRHDVLQRGAVSCPQSAPRVCSRKKPRRNGAKSNGRKYPNGARSCYLSRRGCAKAESAIAEGLWRPVVAAPQLWTSGSEPNGRGHVNAATLDGTHPPSFPSVQQTFPPAARAAGAFFGGSRATATPRTRW